MERRIWCFAVAISAPSFGLGVPCLAYSDGDHRIPQLYLIQWNRGDGRSIFFGIYCCDIPYCACTGFLRSRNA